MESIHFFSEDITFELDRSEQLSVWIGQVVNAHQHEIAEINYIFCSDQYLHAINVEHLQHDTFTDIITFPLGESGMPLMSDIFISIDRVRENATDRELSFEDELHRVMIHGVLHLCGLEDKGDEAAAAMRLAEDQALDMR